MNPHRANYSTYDLELGQWFSASRFGVIISMGFSAPSTRPKEFEMLNGLVESKYKATQVA